MHGRLKVKTDSQKELEKKKEREEKCKQYLSAQKKAFQMRLDQQMDSQSLEITGHLVSINPDFYTIWNFRREIILFIKSQENSDSFEKLCKTELQLTENCLRMNPKSYCVWHQRKWIIEMMPNPDFKTEIMLCNQSLQFDERNFHCWDYRRFICRLAKTQVNDELGFTLQKIEQNFSNFSSWYYRSCLFTSAANNKELDFTKEWKREYDLVENAIFTDPSDQSAWFYHKWLVSTQYGQNMYPYINSETSIKINRLVIDLSGRLVVVVLSRPLKYKPLISLTINDNFLTNTEWKSMEELSSDIWFTNFTEVLGNELKNVSINPIPTFAVNPEAIDLLHLSFDDTNDKQLFVFERKTRDSDHEIALEESYLKSLRELHKMETNNKWVNLTLAWSDPNTTKLENIIEALIKLDPLRINYYKDLKSKTIWTERMKTFQTIDTISLNNMNLSALYGFNRLNHIRCLDLSDNNLVKLSKTFNHLLSLEVLIIDCNKIYRIDQNLKLNKLKVLSLNKNQISEVKQIMILKNLIQLEVLLIKDNPISSSLMEINKSENLFSEELKIMTSESDNYRLNDFKNQLNIYYNLF